jgi:hypothetical protein
MKRIQEEAEDQPEQDEDSKGRLKL